MFSIFFLHHCFAFFCKIFAFLFGKIFLKKRNFFFSFREPNSRRKKFSEKFEIFTKRFFLFAGNPSLIVFSCTAAGKERRRVCLLMKPVIRYLPPPSPALTFPLVCLIFLETNLSGDESVILQLLFLSSQRHRKSQ